jgi:hypothetical protein
MKKFNISLLLFLLPLVSFTQIRLETSIGFGTYSLKGLRNMNSETLKNLPVEARITDDFPAQPYYSAALFYHVSELFYFGIAGNYYTTGSRISYKDFSGELKSDNILSSYSPGIAAGFKLMDKKLKLFEETRISYNFTNLKIKEKIISSTHENDFKSSSLQIEPRLKLSYMLYNFELGGNAGYLFDLGGKNRLADNKDAFLQNSNSKEAIKTGWSGLRLGMSIGYYFHLL